MTLRRIDSELVRRGMAASRTQAHELIAAGRVLLDGEVVTKPARQVDPARALRLSAPTGEQGEQYVSRGGRKLAGVLDALGDRCPPIQGRRCLDAGASTGGFTDVLLRRGAAEVVAVDVGYGQLAWALRTDPRVTVLERTNIRTLTPDQVAPAPTVLVGDLSFISLTLVLPALVGACHPNADFLLLVKPQFEVGKDRLGRGGVVRDPALHVEAMEKVATSARSAGLDVWEAEASPLPGPAGNVEYFLAMRRGHPEALSGEECHRHIAAAVERGPAGGTWKER